MKKILLISLTLAVQFSFGQKFDLAKTPPMGWNSWNTFACDINEDLIRKTADAMVSSGMKDAGYMYINLDDCWHGNVMRRDLSTKMAHVFHLGLRLWRIMYIQKA